MTDYTNTFISGLLSGLTSNIASSIASGVLSGVNIATASIESTVARTQATVFDVFAANNPADKIIEGVIARTGDIATQVRGQLTSFATSLTSSVLARAQAVVQQFLEALKGAFSFLVTTLTKIPSLLVGLLRNIFTAFGSVLRTGFGVVMALFRGAGAGVMGAGRLALGAIPIPAQMAAGLVAGIFNAILRGIGTAVQAGVRAAMAVAGTVIDGIVQFIVAGIGLLARAFITGVQVAINLLLTPFRILTTIAHAIATVFRFAGEVFNAGMRVYELLQRAASHLGITVVQLISAIGSTLAPLLPAIVTIGTSILSFLGALAAPIIAAIFYAVTGAISFAARMMANAVILAFRAVSFVWTQVLVPAAQFLQGAFTGGLQLIGRAWNGVIGAVGYVMAPLVAGARALFSLVWGGLQSAASVIGGWLSSSFAMLRQVVGTAAGIMRDFFATTLPALFSSLKSWVSGLFSKAVGFGGTLLANVAEFGTRLFGVIKAAGTLALTLTAVGIGATAIYQAAKQALEFSNSVSALSARNGLSFGQNATSLRQFAAFGIGADVAGGALKQNPLISGTMAGAFGLPSPNSEGFLNKFLDKYGRMMASGFVGQMMAGSMAKALGMDNDQILALSNISPRQRREQTSYANSISASLGLDPRAIQKFAADVALGMAKVTVAFTGIREKLASIALPIISDALAGVAKFIGDNAGAISNLLKIAVSWLINDAPKLIVNSLQTIVGFVKYAVDGIISIGLYLVQSIPVWTAAAIEFIGQAAQFVTGLVSTVAAGLGDGLLFISDLLGVWSRNIDQIGHAVVLGVAQMLAIVGLSIGEFLRRLGETVGTFVTMSGATVAGWLRAFGAGFAAMQGHDNPVRRFVEGVADTLDGLITAARRFVSVMAGISGGLLDAVRAALMASAPLLSGLIAAVFGLPDSGFGIAAGYRAANELPQANVGQTVREALNRTTVFQDVNNWSQGQAGALERETARIGNDFRQWAVGAGNGWQNGMYAAANNTYTYGNMGVDAASDATRQMSEMIAGMVPKVNAGAEAINGMIATASEAGQGLIGNLGAIAENAARKTTEFMAQNVAPPVNSANDFVKSLAAVVNGNGSIGDFAGGVLSRFATPSDSNIQQIRDTLPATIDEVFAKFGDRLGGRDGLDNPEAVSILRDILDEARGQRSELRQLNRAVGKDDYDSAASALAYMLGLMRDQKVQAIINP